MAHLLLIDDEPELLPAHAGQWILYSGESNP
jgi:hypothetical protein